MRLLASEFAAFFADPQRSPDINIASTEDRGAYHEVVLTAVHAEKKLHDAVGKLGMVVLEIKEQWPSPFGRTSVRAVLAEEA